MPSCFMHTLIVPALPPHAMVPTGDTSLACLLCIFCSCSQFWKSNKMHWCDVCKCWLNDTKAAKSHHEQGMGHKANLARSKQFPVCYSGAFAYSGLSVYISVSALLLLPCCCCPCFHLPRLWGGGRVYILISASFINIRLLTPGCLYQMGGQQKPDYEQPAHGSYPAQVYVLCQQHQG